MTPVEPRDPRPDFADRARWHWLWGADRARWHGFWDALFYTKLCAIGGVYVVLLISMLAADAAYMADPPMVIVAPSGNPAGVKELQDLAKPGVRAAVANKEQTKFGELTQKLLDREGVRDEVSRNVVADRMISALLISRVLDDSAQAAAVHAQDAKAAADRVKIAFALDKYIVIVVRKRSELKLAAAADLAKPIDPDKPETVPTLAVARADQSKLGKTTEEFLKKAGVLNDVQRVTTSEKYSTELLVSGVADGWADAAVVPAKGAEAAARHFEFDVVPIPTRWFPIAAIDNILAPLKKPAIRYTLQLTLMSGFFTAILSLIVAVPIGYGLSRKRFPGRHLLDALLDVPIVLPPLVVGLSLLILFQFPPFNSLSRYVVYQVPGVILAQFMVAAAFAVRTMRATFDQIDPRLEQVALTLGCTQAQAFGMVVLPQAKRGLLTAGTLAWARALGEFGPLLIFAGATRNKTEVLSTTVFLELSIGELEAAVAVSLIMVGCAVLVLITARMWGSRELAL
ncbi:MAG: substrate-binding domain-containing protein [Planctomycetales bacterium]